MENHLPYIEISLDGLLHNLDEVRSRLASGQKIMAVVKDCAYGCGAGPIAQILERNGIGFFAVARMDEARALRECGLLSPILVFGEFSREEALWASANKVRVSINDLASVDILRDMGKRCTVHINIDTGMSRLGILPAETEKLSRKLAMAKSIVIEGLYSHFASADIHKTKTVDQQKKIFDEAKRSLSENGLSYTLVHFPNSAAIVRFPMREVDFVRPGITLYGCTPDPSQRFGLELVPVASLKARVVKIKKVPMGTPVSYGGYYICPHDTHIATIPIGYAHGYPRALSGSGEVLIQGRRYPICGKVTMDYIMVDLGARTKVAVGDEATALGKQGHDTISADELAKKTGTIGYEILTGLSQRVERRYISGGKTIHVQKAELF